MIVPGDGQTYRKNLLLAATKSSLGQRRYFAIILRSAHEPQRLRFGRSENACHCSKAANFNPTHMCHRHQILWSYFADSSFAISLKLYLHVPHQR